VIVAPILERSNRRFGDLIDAPASSEAMAALRGAETISRPLGSPAFLDRLAPLMGRDPRLGGGVLRYKVMSCPLNRTKARSQICQARRRSFLQSK
jgi:hypothetical protein